MGKRDFGQSSRTPILCGIKGETIEIDYEAAYTERMKRIIIVDDFYQAHRRLFIDGFCCTRGEIRTFSLERIHWINELPSGGAFTSCREWLATYGVNLEMVEHHDIYFYRWIR